MKENTTEIKVANEMKKNNDGGCSQPAAATMATSEKIKLFQNEIKTL